MSVVVRFAPSPTGYLHIGSARTALFNYLYAKHTGGKYLLRIEDTDRERSTQSAVEALKAGLAWLDIQHDGEIVLQSQRESRHVEIAHQLVERGMAYYCHETQEELTKIRNQAREQHTQKAFRSKWRELNSTEKNGAVIRLKVPNEGAIIFNDLVQATVEVACDQIEDLVLLRSDGTPTYMLACVVDDHDMQITHIIRGDDHLNNTPKQILIYQAMGWKTPQFAHIPLIHGDDGAKLSKRHGALGVEAYKDMGYLPEALCNYLLRLGWSHGNDEIFSREQAIEWFDIKDINKAPSRLDFNKMENINAHYIKASDNHKLLGLISPMLDSSSAEKAILIAAMDSLKLRAKTLNTLAHDATYLTLGKGITIEEDVRPIISMITEQWKESIINLLSSISSWDKPTIEQTIKNYATEQNLKLNDIMQPLRALLTGRSASISVFEIISLLPKTEVFARIQATH